MKPFDRILGVAVSPWFIFLYLAILVLSYLYFDKAIAEYFHSLHLNVNAPWLRGITALGLGGIYFFSLFLLALFFRYFKKIRKLEEAFWFLWLCVVVPSAICLILKITLGRARPDLWFSKQIYGFEWFQLTAPHWSLPSGHTTTVMGFVFGVSILMPRYGYAIIVAGLVVASSRIFLVHHYLSDVLTAVYLALLEIAILRYVVYRKKFFQSLNFKS